MEAKSSAAAANSTLLVQKQIRDNAADMQSYFSELSSWEKTMKKKDSQLSKKKKKSSSGPPIRGGSATTVTTTTTTTEAPKKPSSPSSHTYDKGYSKWEKFDVDAALNEVDNEPIITSPAEITDLPEAAAPPLRKKKVIRSSPSSNINSTTTKSRELLEKEDGNNHYRKGDFVAAIKCYTRCLGYNPSFVAVLSNRAMCYIKTKEYSKALEDCTRAISHDKRHIKSFIRRASALNSLGRHREALFDLHSASEIEPHNKSIRADFRKTKELLKASVKRVPKKSIKIQVLNEMTAEELPSNSISEPPVVDVVSAPTTVVAPSTNVVVPEKAPKTSYEFGRVWATLSSVSDSSLEAELKLQYVKKIKSTQLRKIFKNEMDSDIMCGIISALISNEKGDGRTERTRAYKFLKAFTTVPRFSMTLMLLSAQEKTILKEAFDFVAAEEGVYLPEGTTMADVNELRETYDLVPCAP